VTPGNRAWFAFVGAAFALMGLNLFLDAPAQAKSLAQLQLEPKSDLKRLERAYMVVGAFLQAVGLGLLAAAVAAPEAVDRYFHHQALTREQNQAAGTAMLLLAFAWGWLKRGELRRRELKFLEGEAPLPGQNSAREKAAAACGWGVILLFAGFALLLIN
jgi:hypothetical protein